MRLKAGFDEKAAGVLGRLDARVKLFAALVMVALVVSSGGFLFPALVLLVSMVLCAWLRVPLRLLALRLAEPLFIVIMVIVLKSLFSGTDEIYSVSVLGIRVAVHADGFYEGLRIALRVLGAVSVIAVVGFASTFSEIIGALGWFRLPRDFVEILIFAYRFLFVLLEEAWAIYTAQRNRLGYCGFLRGIRTFGTLVGSLVIRVFDHTEQTASALRQRGYDGHLPIFRGRGIRFAEAAPAGVFLSLAGALWKLL